MGARARRLRGLTKSFLRRAEEAGRGKSLNEQVMLDVHAVEDAAFVHWCDEKLIDLEKRHGRQEEEEAPDVHGVGRPGEKLSGHR